jgi:hypothetical protein
MESFPAPPEINFALSLMDTRPSPIHLTSALVPRSGKANPTKTASSSNMLGLDALAHIDFFIRGSILDRKGLIEAVSAGLGFGEVGPDIMEDAVGAKGQRR